MASHEYQNKEAIIRAEGLTKRFGELTAVDKVSFSIFKGEIFGLLGPNGAGKTTTIRMLCGLLSPSDGNIFFNGKITSKNEIAAKIGICPQENIHWDKLTCREQLVFMGSMYNMKANLVREKTRQLLEMLGLSEKADVLASKLSGGMKRRLNIALALIHDPEILVLDEPEAGLDPQSRVLVRDFIKSLSKEKTIILTTHNMDEADRLSNRVGIVDRGQLLLIDTPEKLKQTVGHGDILEIELQELTAEQTEKLRNDLSTCCDKIQQINHAILIHAKNLMQKIPEISRKLNDMNLEPRRMTIRQNTLEDVFIHLTGRNLRQ